MKRFFNEIKLEDSIFLDDPTVDLEERIPVLTIPDPRLDGDNFRTNILINGRLYKEISQLCQNQVRGLIDGKGLKNTRHFQEIAKKRFRELYNRNPSWLVILAFEYLILIREQLYKFNLDVQKSKHQLSPIERKGIRFHAGLAISKIFESLFQYQLPYSIKFVDFQPYVRLFNPILLSGSFPEYFLSDYFCYLGIKNPIWTQDRFSAYRKLIMEASECGSSFISVSLTHRGVAAQKLARVIKSKFKDFSDKTVGELIDKIQDDTDILSEALKHRDVKKQFFQEGIPKNVSKQDFLNKLEEEHSVCAKRFPLSRFFQQAQEAEILRKILNYIVLIDPREYSEGFDEIVNDYSLYMIGSPYIYGQEAGNVAQEARATTDTQPIQQAHDVPPRNWMIRCN